MRVIFLLTQSLESPSGIGRYWPLSKELAKLGHNVSIVALHPDIVNLPHRSLYRDGISVNYVSQMHVRKFGDTKEYYSSLSLIMISLFATYKLFVAALRFKPNIIVIGKPHPMNGIAGIIAARLTRSIIVVDVDDYEAESNRFSTKLQKKVVSFFERTVPRFADYVLSNTQYMLSNLRTWGVSQDMLKYLPNGVDRVRFINQEFVNINEIKKSMGLVEKRIILYIGSISLISHPINILIDAFEGIKLEHPTAHILIVGGGEDLQQLIDYAHNKIGGENITFTGRVPHTDVLNYYLIADVSVDPVYDDDAAKGRCPLKLFECWAAGVPFVSANVGDRDILLGTPHAGMLCEPSDPDSLSKAISQILDSPLLAMEFVNRGRELVDGYYWDKLILKPEINFLTSL